MIKFRDKMGPVLFALMAVALLWSFQVGPASAKTYKLTIGSGGATAPLPFLRAAKDFFCPEVSKRVKAATGDEIKWDYQFAGSVAKLGEELEAIQMDLLDAGVVLPIFEMPHLFIHNYAYYAPFGSADIKQATRVNVEVYNKNPWLKEVFEKKFNQKWLASFTYESYDLVTTFPWKTLDDLKGHKIAAAGPNLPWIKTVGCVPVQGNVMEAYTALQTGVYEGWLLPISAVKAMKLNEVADYVSLVGFGCISAGSLTMNLDKWRSLPPEIQEIMAAVGKEYTYVVADWTQEMHDGAITALKDLGVTVYEVPKEVRQAWMRSLGDMPAEKAKEADRLGQPGTKVLKDYIKGMEEAGYTWPVKWKID